MIAAAGCASTTPARTECVWVKPILVTPRDADVISDSLVQQILDHNDKYVEICGGAIPLKP